MSKPQSAELPLWVRDREEVITVDTEVEWRSGRPDYSMTNQFLEKERTCNHAEGSLNAIAHNLVRTFEMEATHKTNPQQWLSVVTDKTTRNCPIVGAYCLHPRNRNLQKVFQ